MKTSTSPWIHQLSAERQRVALGNDLDTDVAIVGAGIAGISTAFFILKNTNKKVAVIEKNILAHGATGHNAGQVVSYFERPFASMVQEFGVDKAASGWAAIEQSWKLLDTMYNESGMTIPFSKFEGCVGFSSAEQVKAFLLDMYERRNAGLNIEKFWIAQEYLDGLGLSDHLLPLVQTMPHKDILNRLETHNASFIACGTHQKGVVNSALFCQEIVKYLEKKYPDRFSLFEHTHINKVILRHDHTLLDAEKHTVKADKVVLCTNGFEKFYIFNEHGLDIDVKFHHNVNGVVGYMSGYLENFNKPPTAISYFTDPDSTPQDPYFYLTRRPYEYEKGSSHNLVCVGGPEHKLDDRTDYIHDFDYPEQAQQDIDAFIKDTYDPEPNRKIEYKFTWHGLMGYTPNGIRLIGAEPKNPVLLYNLGCNGIGILPSIYGGEKVSHIIRGDFMPPSIFDPKA